MSNNTVFALGYFDGVHIGHQALLAAAKGLGRPAGVVTFAQHPDTLVSGVTPRLINTLADREWLLREKFGMDTVITLPFDRAMLQTPWRDFLDNLRRDYGAAGFVCGEDFRFGWRGEGTAQAVADYCRALGLPCAIVPEQSVDGVRVSSTYIRREIETGDMATAVRFLGHPHVLRGTVAHGQALGHRLGFPTANVPLPAELVAPKFGVYACRCRVDGADYPAVTNVGTRPTVAGQAPRVEAWIQGYTGDLYGRELGLEFHFFLRPERKFDTVEALAAQIRQDGRQVRAFFGEK